MSIMSKMRILGVLAAIAAVLSVSAQAGIFSKSNKTIDRPYYTIMKPGKDWVRIKDPASRRIDADVYFERKSRSQSHTVYAAIQVFELPEELRGYPRPTRLQFGELGWNRLEDLQKGAAKSPRFELLDGNSALCQEFYGWCHRIFQRTKDFHAKNIPEDSSYLVMQAVIYGVFHPYLDNIMFLISYNERGQENEIDTTDELFARAKAFLDGFRPKPSSGTPPSESIRAYEDPDLKLIKAPHHPIDRPYYTVKAPGVNWMMVEETTTNEHMGGTGFLSRRSPTHLMRAFIEVVDIKEGGIPRYTLDKTLARKELLHAGKDYMASSQRTINQDPRYKSVEGKTTLCDEFDRFCVRIYERWKDLPTTNKGEYYLTQQRATYSVFHRSRENTMLNIYYDERGRPNELSHPEQFLAGAKAFITGIRLKSDAEIERKE